MLRWLSCRGLDHHGPIVAKTIRRKFITVPGCLTNRSRRTELHLPTAWPWSAKWAACSDRSRPDLLWRQEPAVPADSRNRFGGSRLGHASSATVVLKAVLGRQSPSGPVGLLIRGGLQPVDPHRFNRRIDDGANRTGTGIDSKTEHLLGLVGEGEMMPKIFALPTLKGVGCCGLVGRVDTDTHDYSHIPCGTFGTTLKPGNLPASDSLRAKPCCMVALPSLCPRSAHKKRCRSESHRYPTGLASCGFRGDTSTSDDGTSSEPVVRVHD